MAANFRRTHSSVAMRLLDALATASPEFYRRQFASSARNCLGVQGAIGAPMQATRNVPDEGQATFDRIDRNVDGMIEIEEFSALMLEMNHRCCATEMRACFDAIDADGDGRVTIEELRAWLARAPVVG